MLLPRFSLRAYFAVTVLAAGLFLTIAAALRGQAWAIAVTSAVASVAFALAAYALVFAVAWLFVEGRLASTTPRPANPFATETPPQQVMPPVD